MKRRRQPQTVTPADSFTAVEANEFAKGSHLLKTLKSIVVIFGTRPEVIKLAPVIQELMAHRNVFRTVNLISGQHNGLLYPFVRQFGLRIDYDLKVMQSARTPTAVCAWVLAGLEPILAKEHPDLILVQGDTTTALAGALAGFYKRIPVGHVEAGLRSGDSSNPYPEEMNRQLITRLATYHFAATSRNKATLISEGVDSSRVFVTGNPVVDALHSILAHPMTTFHLAQVLHKTEGLKRIVLTTHRRESFGKVLHGNLKVLRRFIERHDDVAVVFPVHPNPLVAGPARALLSDHPRIHLIQPLSYGDFVSLLSQAWLIVSDSGGVQEEAPTLGKPLLVLRQNTERPEAVASGVTRLVGGSPARLLEMLEEACVDDTWHRQVQSAENPFGRGDSRKRIVQSIALALGLSLSNPIQRPAVTHGSVASPRQPSQACS